MPFEASSPLRPGVNIITVVARENPDTVGRKTIIVRKDGPTGEILQTPKTEEEGEAGGETAERGVHVQRDRDADHRCHGVVVEREGKA